MSLCAPTLDSSRGKTSGLSPERYHRGLTVLSRLTISLFAAGSAFLLCGCPSFLVQGRARPIEPGRYQFFANVHGAGVVETTGFPAVMPGLEIGLRRGLTERLEVGGRLSLGGLGFDAKIALKKAPTPDEGIDWAIDPGLAYGTNGIGSVGISPGIHNIDLHLPLLIGFNFSRGRGLVIGPRVVQRITVMASPGAPTSYTVIGGASAGFDWPLTTNFHLFPELSLYMPLATAGRGYPFQAATHNGLGFQFAIGMLWGGH